MEFARRLGINPQQDSYSDLDNVTSIKSETHSYLMTLPADPVTSDREIENEKDDKNITQSKTVSESISSVSTGTNNMLPQSELRPDKHLSAEQKLCPNVDCTQGSSHANTNNLALRNKDLLGKRKTNSDTKQKAFFLTHSATNQDCTSAADSTSNELSSNVGLSCAIVKSGFTSGKQQVNHYEGYRFDERLSHSMQPMRLQSLSFHFTNGTENHNNTNPCCYTYERRQSTQSLPYFSHLSTFNSMSNSLSNLESRSSRRIQLQSLHSTYSYLPEYTDIGCQSLPNIPYDNEDSVTDKANEPVREQKYNFTGCLQYTEHKTGLKKSSAASFSKINDCVEQEDTALKAFVDPSPSLQTEEKYLEMDKKVNSSNCMPASTDSLNLTMNQRHAKAEKTIAVDNSACSSASFSSCSGNVRQNTVSPAAYEKNDSFTHTKTEQNKSTAAKKQISMNSLQNKLSDMSTGKTNSKAQRPTSLNLPNPQSSNVQHNQSQTTKVSSNTNLKDREFVIPQELTASNQDAISSQTRCMEKKARTKRQKRSHSSVKKTSPTVSANYKNNITGDSETGTNVSIQKTTGAKTDVSEHIDSSADDDIDLSEIQMENRKLKDAKLCRICKDKEANRLFLPCAHLACCALCSPAVVKCPQCRSNIRGIVSVYFP